MISKYNIKYCILISFISILIYKIIDNPLVFINTVKGLFKFLSPFLFAVLMCLILNPIIIFFENKLKIPRFLNISISYLLVFLFICLCINLIMPSLIKTLNTLIAQMPSYTTKINLILNKIFSKNNSIAIILPTIQNHLDSLLKNIVNMLSNISSDFFNYIISIASLFFNFIMGVILSIYILYDKENLIIKSKNLLKATFTEQKNNQIIEFFNILNNIFYHYIIGSLVVSLIVGIISFIGFKFLNIQDSLFLSFIVFLTNMIPYFGPFIGALPPIILTLSYSPIKAFWITIFLFVLQQIDGNFITPKIMGEFVGIKPLWIVCAVLIGGSLFGFIGMFLSVPIAALIKNYLNKYINNNLN